MLGLGEADKNEKMRRILSELKEKMGEIDALKKQLQAIEKRPQSAERSKALLEEIQVPSLELIQDAPSGAPATREKRAGK